MQPCHLAVRPYQCGGQVASLAHVSKTVDPVNMRALTGPRTPSPDEALGSRDEPANRIVGRAAWGDRSDSNLVELRI